MSRSGIVTGGAGFIGREQLLALAAALGKIAYGHYLRQIADETA